VFVSTSLENTNPFPFGAIKEAASEKLRVQCFFQILLDRDVLPGAANSWDATFKYRNMLDDTHHILKCVL